MLLVVKAARGFFKHILEKKYLIYELTIRDFSSKYAGSYFGNIWAVLDAFLFIAVLWIVFGIGLRGGAPVQGAPFIAYLSVGFMAYWFFDTTITNGTSALHTYAFLMQRVDFRASILPVVMVLSNILKHLCVMAAVLLVLLANGIRPSVYWLQLPYYVLALSAFSLGITWITSSISPFFQDIKNLISVMMRFLFFGSPIFWTTENFPEKLQTILAINPLYYILTGYRDSLIYHRPFWEHPGLAAYFWALTLIALLLGVVIHLRLKPHFMDVL